MHIALQGHSNQLNVKEEAKNIHVKDFTTRKISYWKLKIFWLNEKTTYDISRPWIIAPRLLMLSFSFTYCNILTSIRFISTFRNKIWEYLQIQTSMEQLVIALGYSNAENKKVKVHRITEQETYAREICLGNVLCYCIYSFHVLHLLQFEFFIFLVH